MSALETMPMSEIQNSRDVQNGVGQRRSAPSTKKSPLDGLAEQVGDFIKYWGFKRVHGQIWVHLFLSKEALDAGQLIRRLGVSKALISMSLSDLLSYDVVRRAGKSSHGTQLFEANLDVIDVIINVLKQREVKLIAKTRASYELVESLSSEEKDKHSIDQERLDALKDLLSAADTLLSALVKLGSIDCGILRRIGGVTSRAFP